MNDFLKIKCPGCGSILQLKKQPNLDSKSVTCPICKLKSFIGDCEKLEEKWDDDKTLINPKQKGSSDETTIVEDNICTSAGRLVNTQTGKEYQLKQGRNAIGRQIENPLPTVTIAIEETQTRRTMSREHAIIEVTRLGNGGYRHFLYNWKGKNGTYVNGTPVADGERVVLSHGQTIKMGQVLLRFEIP